jgi:cold shock CspA family protein
MTTGTVTWVDVDKGCGFIAPDGEEKEFFVSRWDMSPRSGPLRAGARVDFEERGGPRLRTAVMNVAVRPTSLPFSAEEAPESDAEYEGMPPKPERDRAAVRGGVRT